MLQPVYEYEDQVTTLKANNTSLQASVVPIIQQHLRETASPGNHAQQPDCDGASDNSNESFDENMSEQGLMVKNNILLFVLNFPSLCLEVNLNLEF